MKRLGLAVLFSVIVLAPQAGVCDSDNILSSIDKTKQWKLPYEVETKRANELHEGVMKLSKKTGIVKVSDALKLFGSPDVVTDIDGPFAGLSPKEDRYLVAHRSEIKWRLVWYLQKKGFSPNLYDTWIGIYTKKVSDEIETVILN